MVKSTEAVLRMGSVHVYLLETGVFILISALNVSYK